MGGIAGPFGTICVCAIGVATSSAASKPDTSSARLRFRVRMASPCYPDQFPGSEPEYHVELRRPRCLLVVLNQVEVRVVRQVCAGPVPLRVAAGIQRIEDVQPELRVAVATH